MYDSCDGLICIVDIVPELLGAENVVGTITEGKVADVIVCSNDYTTKTVFLAGKEYKES